MNTFHLIFKEIVHRKWNFLLSVLAVLTAVALFVFFFITGKASKNETRVIMRDMGFNLRIIPKQTDMSEFWANGFSDYTMPEDYVERLASQRGIIYNHLQATLQRKVEWRSKEVMLTGILLDVSPPGKKESPMGFFIESGNVYLGFELASSLNLNVGDSIYILNKSFRVANVLPKTESTDDIRIYGHLHDVQEILGIKDRINEIEALECVCFIMDEELSISPEELRLKLKDKLRKQLAEILPNTKVIEMETIAKARLRQRWVVMKYFSLVFPFLMLICAVWVGVLSWLNVRERQYEIGIIRALGFGSSMITLLFLGRAIFVGFIGAVFGYCVGAGLALSYGPEIFKVTSYLMKPEYTLLGLSLLVAPLFAAFSSFIPTVVAITLDPAQILSEE